MFKFAVYFKKLITVVGGLCLITIFMVMMTQITARYVFNSPFPWPEELSLFLMAPLTFVGAYLAIIHDEHLSITFVLEKAPPAVRRLMMIFDRMVIVVFLFVAVYYSYGFLQTAGLLKTAVLAIPMWCVYGIMWVCCILMLLESVFQIVLLLMNRYEAKGVTE